MLSRMVLEMKIDLCNLCYFYIKITILTIQKFHVFFISTIVTYCTHLCFSREIKCVVKVSIISPHKFCNKTHNVIRICESVPMPIAL
jgi:hypothetical protein